MLNVFFLAQIATANASLESAQGISSSNILATSGTHKFRVGANGDTTLSHHDELNREMVGRHLGKASKTYQGALKKHTWGRIALWSVVLTLPICQILVTLTVTDISVATIGSPASLVWLYSVAGIFWISAFVRFILTIFQLFYGTTPFRVIAVLYLLTSIVLEILKRFVGQVGLIIQTIIVVFDLFYYIVSVLIPFVRLQGWSKVSFFYN